MKYINIKSKECDVMELVDTENAICKNVFLHNREERQEAFTQLWVQLINARENGQSKKYEDLQTNITLL